MTADSGEASQDLIELDELSRLDSDTTSTTSCGSEQSSLPDSESLEDSSGEFVERTNDDSTSDNCGELLLKSKHHNTKISDVPRAIERLEDRYFEREISREEYFTLRAEYFSLRAEEESDSASGPLFATKFPPEVRASILRKPVIIGTPPSFEQVEDVNEYTADMMELPYCEEQICTHTLGTWPNKCALLVKFNEKRTRILCHNFSKYYVDNAERIMQWLVDNDSFNVDCLRKDVDALIWDDLWARFCGKNFEILPIFVQMLRTASFS